jgi:hypothetical protein
MSAHLQDTTARRRRLISVLVRGAIGVALVVSLLVVLRPV